MKTTEQYIKSVQSQNEDTRTIRLRCSDTRTIYLRCSGVFIVNFEDTVTHCFGIFIVSIEQVNFG